ncbi:MAG: sigma-54-dependent Fis family transcriptional regulator, partial [Candidatus Tectomicrobia bacterium]|nr:sigma-54-dependent Fis family transcriptional regulator [Candidatus Tectomicrobia bacterium]
MDQLRVLVVDDEFLVRWSLKEDLSNRGYEVMEAETGEEALKKIRRDPPDLTLLDIRLPGMDGLKVLQEIKAFNGEVIIIMMTAFGEVETAVKSMKLGAYDYISKPFNLDEVAQIVKKALEMTGLKKEVERLREQLKERYGFDSIIGESPSMHEVFEMVKRIAESDATTVLLRGESGTGKDLI